MCKYAKKFSNSVWSLSDLSHFNVYAVSCLEHQWVALIKDVRNLSFLADLNFEILQYFYKTDFRLIFAKSHP